MAKTAPRRKPGAISAAAAQFLAVKDRPSDPEPDPLAGLPDTGTSDIEKESDDEADAIIEGFRGRMRRENDRFRRATDTEHWIAVCFVDREAHAKGSSLRSRRPASTSATSTWTATRWRSTSASTSPPGHGR